MRFSDQEIKDLLIAWIAITIAVAIALRGAIGVGFGNLLWIAALTVGVGFVVHELAHKFTAQHYGKFAEFRAQYSMLLGAIVISFLGIVFAAPGAVVISGFVSRKQSGIIAAAGPISNMVLAFLFIPIYFFSASGSIPALFFGFGILVNSWLALFNLFPFYVFDGAKVLNWNKFYYSILALVGVILVFLSGFIYQF